MIYLFDNQENLIKILTQKVVKSIYHTQELTDEHYVSDRLLVEVKAMKDTDLSKVSYIGISSLNQAYKYELFFVVKHKTENNITEFVGVQSGIEELRKSPIYDIRPNGNLRQHAERIVLGTNWTIGYVPDSSEMGVDYYYMSAFDALKKMCESFGVEMQFHVEINGNRIGNRYIELKNKIGTVTHRRIAYGHNALEIVKEVEKINLVTALIGRGRGEEVSSAEENESGQAGYGRKINFSDITWTKGVIGPVDKPFGQQYVEIKEATNLYGIKMGNQMMPKIGFIEFDTDDRNILIQRTYEALVELARPQVLFRTSAAYLTAEIGDTVRVVRPDLNIDYPARVVKVEWDCLANKAVSLEIGDKINDSFGSQLKSFSKDVESRITDFVTKQTGKIVESLPSADGFNRNWYGETEPSNPRINDIWYMPDPEHEGRFKMVMWTGEIWKRLDLDLEEFESKIAQVENQIEAMANQIDDAEVKAQQALESAGATTDLANEAKSIAENAKSELLEKFNDYVTESNFESFQEITNEAINQRLTATQIENEINSKGFSTVTQLNNLRTETAGLIEQNITSIKSEIPTGGRNYFLNGESERFSTRYIQFPVRQYLESEVGNNWCLSFDLKINLNGILRPLTIYHYQANGISIGGQKVINPTLNYQRYFISGEVVNINRGSQYDPGSISIYDFAGNNNYSIKNIKLEKGLAPTDYSRPIEETVTEVAFQRLKQSTDLWELIIGKTQNDVKTNISQIVSSSEIFQSTIQSFDSRNYVKDGTFPSRNIGAWTDLAQNSGVSLDFNHSSDNLGKSGIHMFGTANRIYVGIAQQFKLKAKAGEKITLSALVSQDGYPDGRLEIGIHYRQNGQIVSQSWDFVSSADFLQGYYKRFVLTKTLPNNIDELNIMFYAEQGKRVNYYLTEIALNLSSYFTGYSDAVEDLTAVKTQMTQMAGSFAIANLNARGDILSQVNLINENVKIQGRLIHLSGQSLIDDAVIKSSHIDSLSASKIKAGTLDASQMNVTNLNVNSLVGNRSDFIRTHWNAINSRVSIDGIGLRVSHNDGSYTLIGASGLETVIGGTGYRTKYLTNSYHIENVKHTQHQPTKDTFGNQINMGYYLFQLPSIYHGKPYTATASLSDIQFYDYGNQVLSRVVAYVDQTAVGQYRAQGRVPIVGYAIYTNLTTRARSVYPVAVQLTVTL